MRPGLAPALLGVVCALALAVLWRADRPPAPLAPPAPGAVTPNASAGGDTARMAPSSRAARAPGTTARTAADPIGTAPDLKRVFDDHSIRSDPVSQRIAARAFGACVPAFLGSQGETPSPEPLIRALPAQDRAAREAAYRSLFARCAGIAGEPRDVVQGTLRSLRDSASAQEPGVRAVEDLQAGRFDRVDVLVAQGLVASDPAAVAGMAGVASALAQTRGADAALVQRAQEVDAALPLVACDLGLDCSANALTALQLCAAEGACDGDYRTRVASRYANLDASRVQAERARLLALIQLGRPLASSDLLP